MIERVDHIPDTVSSAAATSRSVAGTGVPDADFAA
jgi:hypothetical protein